MLSAIGGGKITAASELGNGGHFDVHRSVDVEAETQKVANLIGEASRARMLASLMDGRARTAKELAFVARITPQTASSHLGKLVDGAVLTVETQGRHRYFRISRDEVAGAIEALMRAGYRPGMNGVDDAKLPGIKFARICYDHLAGRVGVEVLSSLVRCRYLAPQGRDYELTQLGEAMLTSLGINLPAARRLRRRFACSCLDWSEQRPHLGGALGMELTQRYLSNKWLRRCEDSRAVVVTEIGRRELATRFGLVFPL